MSFFTEILTLDRSPIMRFLLAWITANWLIQGSIYLAVILGVLVDLPAWFNQSQLFLATLVFTLVVTALFSWISAWLFYHKQTGRFLILKISFYVFLGQLLFDISLGAFALRH